jgi:hypothetical protein
MGFSIGVKRSLEEAKFINELKIKVRQTIFRSILDI